MKSVYLTGAALLIIGFGAIGCSNTAEGAKEDTTQDATAVKNATDQAAQKTVEGTAAAGKAIEQGAAKAGDAVKEGTDAAVKTTEQAAVKTGEAVKEGADTAVKSTEQAAAKAGDAVKGGTKQASDALGLTPTVKGAILKDPAFSDVKSYDINVDTTNDTVYLKGRVDTNDMKKKAGGIAQDAVKKANSPNKVVNQLTVQSH